jgi:hypothetical protein
MSGRISTPGYRGGLTISIGEMDAAIAVFKTEVLDRNLPSYVNSVTALAYGWLRGRGFSEIETDRIVHRLVDEPTSVESLKRRNPQLG